MPLSFKEQRARAREWEQRIAAECRKQGYYVIPTFDFSGVADDRAPQMSAPPGEASAVLPDLQLLFNGKIEWLEIKTKQKATYWEKGKYFETGFAKRHYEDYQRVERESGGQCYVLFVHLQEGEMRGDSLRRLLNYESHGWDGPGMDRGGTVFWRYDKIPRWGSVALGAGDATASVAQFTQLFTESPELPPRKHPAPVLGRIKPPVKCTEPLVRPAPGSRQTDFFKVLDQPRHRAIGGRR